VAQLADGLSILLTDIVMPASTACPRPKASKDFPDMPILLMTALRRAAARTQPRALIHRVIAKPSPSAEICEAVEDALQR